MSAIAAHLEGCGPCHREFATLQETKSLVASLAVRAPRTELRELLQSSLQQSAPPSLKDRLSWWWEENVASNGELRIRPRTLAATAVFSVAGLWLATVSTDGPHDWHRRTPPPDYRMTPPMVVFWHPRFFAGRHRCFRACPPLFSRGTIFPTFAPAKTMDGGEYVAPRSLTPVTLSGFGPMSPPQSVWGQSASPTGLISVENRLTRY